MGRRRAHATYHASHEVDASSGLTFAMDLTPLINGPDLPAGEYMGGYLERFAAEIARRLARLNG